MMNTNAIVALALVVAVAVSGCGGRESGSEGANAKKATAGFSQIKRADFNRRAAELYLPLFWRNDANGNGVLDPGELVTIWGVDGGGLADYVDSAGSSPSSSWMPTGR